uniref:Uncharacterized protein n=1 Tax=Ditylenchus dipsaci TaxID=166011 RepID=A0A915DF84_9BILA
MLLNPETIKWFAPTRQQQCYLDEDSNTLYSDPAEFRKFSHLESSEICEDMNVADWIEAEIVIDDVLDQPTLLPDGQIDIELD